MRHPFVSALLDRFRAATFRRQLTITATVGVLGMAAVSAIVSSWQGTRQARQTLIGQGLSLAGSLAQQSQLALLTGAADNAREAVGTAFAFPDVTRVEIRHADGRLLLERGEAVSEPSIYRLVDSGGPYLETETDQVWRFIAPVMTGPREGSQFEMEERPPELIGYVRVVQGKATLGRLVAQLVLINIGLGLGFAVLFLWLLHVLTRRLTRPLSLLAEVMSRAQAGQPGLRAEVGGPRDIAYMAHAFNGMMAALEEREKELQQKNEQLIQHAVTLEARVAERTAALLIANDELQQTLDSLKNAQASLLEAEKQASLGRLVAGVAHELNTPLGNALTVVTSLDHQYRGLVGLLEAGTLRRSELRDLAARGIEGHAIMLRNIGRAVEIIQSFKQLAIDQTSEMRRSYDLTEVVNEVLGSLQPSFKHTPYRVDTALENQIAMDSFPGPLGQVITNITLNALVHAFPGRAAGLVTIESRRLDDDQVLIVCRDDGVGMDETIRRRIFEPFFTTKFGKGGSGLGMHIVHTIVTGLLGGSIQVDSAPGNGSAFIITLPLTAPQRDAGPQSASRLERVARL